MRIRFAFVLVALITNAAAAQPFLTGLTAGPPPGVGDPGTPDFIDDFDYTLDRVDTYANKAAIAATAGWSDLRDANQSEGRYGYLYTVAPVDVAGHTGTFPGSSQRALMVERFSTDIGGLIQSDIFVSLGALPADICYRYWIYLVDSGAQQSEVGLTDKHVYPTNGIWPAVGDDEAYIIAAGSTGYQQWALGNESWDFGADITRVFFGLTSRKQGEVDPITIDNDAGHTADVGVVWQNLSATSVQENSWYEATFRINVSGAQGTYEAWLRPRDGARVKTAEWIGGVTTDFTWATTANDRDGQAGMQFPSVGQGHTDPVISGWNFMLFQDFQWATACANLRTYADEP